VTHSYYLPESYQKHVYLTIKARYNKDSPNKALAYVSVGTGNNQTFAISNLTEEYQTYSYMFYQSSRYIGFNVVETANQNKKTTVDFKDIYIQYLDLSDMPDPDISLSYSNTGYKFTNTQMIDGNSEMPNPSGGTMLGRAGSGYARITNLDTGTVYNFSYTGSPQEFKAPTTGKYKIECWGAAGGDISSPVGSNRNIASRAGRGAYTSGELTLLENKVLYVYVGGAGTYGKGVKQGGWNGGGTNGKGPSWPSGGGGGATDIRTINGNWDNLESLKSRIMVAGAGGGADDDGGTVGGGNDGRGGSGGTFISESAYINGVISRNFFASQVNGQEFGKGGSPTISATDTGGGGGGWYGGRPSNNSAGGGAGGSSYISGHRGCIAYHNKDKFLSTESYEEDSQYKGSFNINVYDLRDELVNKDWYVRIYRKGTLVETHQYDLIGTAMEDIEKSYKFDKNVNYTVKISVKVRERYYDLAAVDFTTESEIRAIRTPQEFQSMHTNGKYIVLNDMDFGKTSYSYESYFYGEIDFQGHTITRKVVSSGNNRMFYSTRAGAVVKNLVVDYYLDNITSVTNFHGIVYSNSGTLDNIIVNLKESNDNPNIYISLITRENYGIVQNFVINAEARLSCLAGSGYLSWYNSGIIRNGYVHGENIYAYYQNVETRDKKDTGGLTGYAEYNSRIETVFSLVSVEKTNTYGTGDRENVVSNIVGRHQSGYFGNSYSVEFSDKTNTNLLTQDPNIGFKNGLRFNKLYYSSDKTYGGKFSSKISKLALYDKTFQNDILNKYDGFTVDSFVELGYFPQVKMNDCMPRQEWIELPKVTGADLVDVTSVEEISNNGDSAVVKLHINNPSSEKIEKVTITDIKTVNILEQKDLYGKTDLTVELKDPIAYKSIYYVDTITLKPAYGSNYEKIYEKNERAINVDLYCPVYTRDDWKKIVAKPTQNYALMDDIDFMNVSMTQYMVTANFTAKLDGRGHTLKNITINSGNALFTRVSGGTIKNLNIENYKKTNATTYGGVVYETNNNSTFDNVHLKNIQVYANNRIGGLMGYGSYTTIKNSSVTNFKPLTPPEAEDLYVGSFVGYSDYLFVENCFAQDIDIDISDAISTLGIGGIGGTMWNGTISNSYAVGKINCNSVNVGGIYGYGGSRIFNVWTYVDIMTNLDYVGGIVGKRDNSNISNTLSLGAVYSSYKSNETDNINSTPGNAMDVIQNNYAWDKQKYYGFVKGTMSSEVLITTEDLREENTYVDLIGFDDKNFDFSQIEDNIVPKIKNPETGELVPNQVDKLLTQ
ncbi:MAG: hypothetical protein IJ193_01445, partial [Bacilli bacterium]|nr:hypothetical protein [Bacilli bacterium]